MATWQRPVRVGLAAFVVAFGFAVLLGIQDRGVPAPAAAVDRDDPDAIIQSRGARIVQSNADAEELTIDAESTVTYPEGTVRLFGVTVTGAEREDRVGFTLSGDEATADEEQGTWRIVGSVRFVTDDGLVATTAEATYLAADGIVRMPGAASFARNWMSAYGDTATYDRRQDLLHLEPAARVQLLEADGTSDPVGITAGTATVAQTDGYMRFAGGTTVRVGGQTMAADEAHATLGEGAHLEALELNGDARISGDNAAVGQLRLMTAPGITVVYDAGQPDHAELVGGARIEFFGQAGSDDGARIAAQSMEVRLGADGGGVREVRAREEVVVELPPEPDGDLPGPRISADALEIVGDGDAALSEARFDGAVVFREPSASGDDGEARIVRAQRLEAQLGEGLVGLDAARFIGGVGFEDGATRGEADEARYDVVAGTLTLITLGAAGQTPRIVDRRGSIQADTVAITLDGHEIEATGEVESVLLSSAEDGGDPSRADEDGRARRPGLLADDQRIYVTAGLLEYDPDQSVARYSATAPATARLWQETTEFQGTAITLDEATGSIGAEGNARSRSIIVQINDETGELEPTMTTGRGETVHYDDETRRAVYSTNAELESDRVHLKADTIELYLHDDAQTLDRIVAVGNVALELTGRKVTGTTMTYYDSDGRYQMEGEPVRIVEETDGGCRETTGRTLTFFITDEAVTIDGDSEVRTESASATCAAVGAF